MKYRVAHRIIAGARKIWLILFVQYLCSCIDSKYDLSDIDSSARIEFKDVSVPLSVENISLGAFLKPKDGEKIQIVENENGDSIYAAFISGFFESNPITIQNFNLKSTANTPTEIQLHPLPLSDGVVSFPIHTIECSLNITGQKIDSAIHGIEKLGVDGSINIILKIKEGECLSKYSPTLSGIKIQCPQKLEASTSQGTYNPETGIIDLSDQLIPLDENGRFILSLKLAAINVQNGDAAFNPEQHLFSLCDKISLLEGNVCLSLNQTEETEIQNGLTFSFTYSTTDIKVTSFSGQVEYQLDNFDIPPADFNSLPSFLKEEETRIHLKNPQIYFELYNPLTPYNIYVESGFSLSPQKDVHSITYSIDGGEKLQTSVGQRLSTFVLSPEKPEVALDGFNSPVHLKFSQLKDILYTEYGVPEKIGIEVIDAKIPLQQVRNLPIGSSIGEVEGFYTFYAPLELTLQSHISYSSTIDLKIKDDDKLCIRKMSVSGLCSHNFPIDSIRLSLMPQSDTPQTCAKTQSILLSEADKEQPFQLSFDYDEQPVPKLEKLKIVCEVDVSSGKALQPSHHIQLDKLKINIDGYYE